QYNKLTNKSENDYSDLINMLDVLNRANPDTYYADVSEVINVEQWLRYLAIESLFNNQETSPNTGNGDDFLLYSGVEDPRFVLIPHDMDTIFGGSTTYGIFTGFDQYPGLLRLLHHPDIEPLFYATFRDLIDTVWNPEVLNPLIDRVLSHVSVGERANLKNWVVARTAGVLAQIPWVPQPGNFSINTDLPMVSGYRHTTKSGARLFGSADAETGSVLVDGVVADFTPATGGWSIEEGTSGTLVASGSATTYHVPTVDEDPLTWTETAFDDSAWSGTRKLLITEVGIDTPDFMEIQNVSDNSLRTEGWVVAINHGGMRNVNAVQTVVWELPEIIEGKQTLYRSDANPGADDYFGEGIVWSTQSIGWVMIVDDTGNPVDFVVWGYREDQFSAFDVTINGGRIRAADVWHSAPVNSSYSGIDPRSLQRFGDADRDGDSDFDFLVDLSMGTQNPLLVFPHQGNRQAPGSTGFGFGADVANFAIRTDVEAIMRGNNASFWTRIPFESPDPALFDALRLQIKYNDGFVAYLNGQEIARKNAPDDLLWNSTAMASRTPQQSLLSETIDVTGWLGALLPGENILAVHGLNIDASDENFFLLPELIGTFRSDASMGLTLDPGINRVWVETFEGANGTGEQRQREFIDIWSGSAGAAIVIPEGPIAGELSASDGPYLITGNTTVEAGTTLVIRPGTTLYFANGAALTVKGRLLAEGDEHQSIRFTQVPGSGTNTNWDGIQFVDTTEDNRITHAVIEYATTAAGMVGLRNSNLLIDNATFDHAERRRIGAVNSSLIVRNSTFTEIFPGNTPPLTDGGSEHLFGRGIPDGGHFILDNNVFGAVKGRNNAVDFNAIDPDAVIQIINNTFLGSGDDTLDLWGDARIEGNVFTHVHKDSDNSDLGESSAIAISNAQELFVTRNVFYDVGHAVILKDGSLMTFINNTIANASAAAIDFDPAPQAGTPGLGASVDSTIFIDAPIVFADVVPTTELTVNRSILPVEYHGYGDANLDGYVLLVDPAGGDFHVAGTFGQGKGAMVPTGLSISGEPSGTAATDVTLTVDTSGRPYNPTFLYYKYRLNDGAFSAERSIDQPIELADLPDGDYTVYVIGKNSIGLWQDEAEATASKTWTVDPDLWRVRINEVLANNVAAFNHEGTYPDLIELVNDGGQEVDLSGMSLSDNLDNPTKFVFPSGTVLEPGEYLVLFADDRSNRSGIHLGFALDSSGEGVYLFDKLPEPPPVNPLPEDYDLLDSVEFGLQLPDASIGRVDTDAHWALTQPTFGERNIGLSMGSPSTLKINEWLADAGMRFTEDFLELYNPNGRPVPLAGLFLTDDPVGQPDKHEIASLSFIAGRGYAVFVLDDTTDGTANHLGFKLSAEFELIGLYSPQLREIDKLIYFPQTTDVSRGRNPDGATNFQFFVLPTPGAPNAWMPDALELLDGLRVTELMYHPVGDEEL
ncbi:MAG: lamin tail domain-containing protein, partial [Thermoguttaceae bacterium]